MLQITPSRVHQRDRLRSQAIWCKSDKGRLTDLKFTLEGQIERQTGCPAQVVVLNEAPTDLVHRVLRDGRLMVDRDPSTRLRFEFRARNDYFDLLPTLQRYRRMGLSTP